jgi:hypothetical protein
MEATTATEEQTETLDGLIRRAIEEANRERREEMAGWDPLAGSGLFSSRGRRGKNAHDLAMVVQKLEEARLWASAAKVLT